MSPEKREWKKRNDRRSIAHGFPTSMRSLPLLHKLHEGACVLKRGLVSLFYEETPGGGSLLRGEGEVLHDDSQAERSEENNSEACGH